MDYKVTDSELISIANAIRTKGGTSAQLEFPTEFVSAINDISGGGGGGVVQTYEGTSEPSSSLGSNGDIYFRRYELPSNINFVEYLQSSGTQYIDTGIKGSQSLSCEVKFVMLEPTAVLGATDNSSNTGSAMFAILQNSVSGYGCNDVSFYKNNFRVFSDVNKVNVIKFGQKSILQDNVRVFVDAPAFQTSGNIILFGFRLNSEVKARVAKIMRATFFQNGLPIKDYVPAKDSNNVACMYESISGQFVNTSGSDSFTSGSVVTPETLTVEYRKRNGVWQIED